ncbi:MAG: ribosomal protein S18-alanine N-acetyltransferase [Dehalococcoidales bacterium]
MSFYVRRMRKEDVAQVKEIDHEVFPTQWASPNYHRELQNRLAHYIVVCDRDKIIEESEVKAPLEKGVFGLASKIRWWLSHNRFFGDRLPPPGSQYIIGFAGIWVAADEAHLTNIAVRKRYQQQGIGELLLISMIDLAIELKANFITLEVRASNTPAQNLYHKYGFTQVGVRRGYYTDNREDGLLMSVEGITSAPFQTRLQELKQTHLRKYGIVNSPVAKGGCISTE